MSDERASHLWTTQNRAFCTGRSIRQRRVGGYSIDQVARDPKQPTHSVTFPGYGRHSRTRRYAR